MSSKAPSTPRDGFAVLDELARADVFDYIETFYNRCRRRSSLNCLSPAEYEARAKAA